MKRNIFWLLTLLVHLTSYCQTDYFVSTSGNNMNTGTSIGQAWKTIQYAMDNAPVNSVVHILAGTYNEKVEVNVSGAAGQSIVFKNYQSDSVTISGTGISSPEAVIGIFDQSYVTIQGLHITDNQQLDAQGILVEGNCQHLQILNNEVSHIHFSSNPNDVATETTNSQPIIVYGTDPNNAISDLVISGNLVRDSRTGYSEGLAINGNVDGFIVEDNIVHNITNIGIDAIGHEGTASSNDQARNGTIRGNHVYNCVSPYATAGGIYIDGAKDITVENNIVHHNQWGIEVGCEHVGQNASGIIVRNNFIYSNEDSGIALGGFDFPSGSGKVMDSEITNNTCFDNDANSGGIGGVTGEVNISYVENCTIQNNVFFTRNGTNLVLYVDNVGSTNLTLDYNLYYFVGTPEFEYESNFYTSLAAYQSGENQDINSLFTNPLFESTVVPDLHLTANSPAINSGNSAYIPDPEEEDIDGENRIIDGRVDIGADERNTTTSAHIITMQDCIGIYPNPFTDQVIIDGDFDQFDIEVFDSSGMSVTNYTGSTPPITIDLTGLLGGTYFISIQHQTKGQLGIYTTIKE